MKTISRGILAAPRLLGAVAVSLLVAGCGGSTSTSYQPPGMSQSARAQNVSSPAAMHDASCPGQRSFQYVGHAQLFRVPKCATTVYVDAKGATGKYGGYGGGVSATIPVTPGETLIITVGGAGRKFKGGFNGGAAGARVKGIAGAAGGGGGATDVRRGGSGLAQRVVVAGGGGGQDNDGPAPGAGGTGGGLPDGSSGGTPRCDMGTPIGGGGGTQSSGGTGGAGSNGGSLGNGGVGVATCVLVFEGPTYVYLSSGGGGGYYGGGGDGGGGGGGSGYAEPTASNVSAQNGINTGGDGSALICWGYSNGECGSRQRQ
jgi:hypothetical protein